MTAGYCPTRANCLFGNKEYQLSRGIPILLFGVLTSHSGLKRQLSAKIIVGDDPCPECQEEEDINFPLLAQCPVRSRMRYAAIAALDLNEKVLKGFK